MKEYLCDAQIVGKGYVRGITVWLSSKSQAEAKKALQALFPDDCAASVQIVLDRDRDQRSRKSARSLFDDMVTATVDDTQQLYWWLRSFGPDIEIERPTPLRHRMAKDVAASVTMYRRAKPLSR